MDLVKKRVAVDVPVGPERLVLVRLGERCNHACPMCTNTKRPEVESFSTGEMLRRIGVVAAMGFKRVVLTGGEPTIHEGFFELAEAARAAGMTWDLNTHGRSFHRVDFAERARSAGLQRAIVSLHSHRPDVSALMSGAPRTSFEQTVAGVQNLRDQGVSVTLNCVLSTLNVGDVEDYLAFAATLSPGLRVKLCFPSLLSQGVDWGPVQLRLRDVREVLRAVPAWSLRYGVAVDLESVPSCVDGNPDRPDVGRLGFGETHYLDDRTGNHVVSIAWAEAESAVFAPFCVRCAAFERCSGVGRLYAERHGVDELAPFATRGGSWFV